MRKRTIYFHFDGVSNRLLICYMGIASKCKVRGIFHCWESKKKSDVLKFIVSKYVKDSVKGGFDKITQCC